MMRYDYMDAMKKDIREYAITEEIKEQIREGNREEVEQELNDNLFVDDSITGNASGSYTFNSYQAQCYVVDNMELVQEVVSEFCIEAETVAEHFVNADWEYWDVSIRCYLLGQAISEVLDEIEDEIEKQEAADEIPEQFIETVSRNGSASVAG